MDGGPTPGISTAPPPRPPPLASALLEVPTHDPEARRSRRLPVPAPRPPASLRVSEPGPPAAQAGSSQPHCPGLSPAPVTHSRPTGEPSPSRGHPQPPATKDFSGRGRAHAGPAGEARRGGETPTSYHSLWPCASGTRGGRGELRARHHTVGTGTTNSHTKGFYTGLTLQCSAFSRKTLKQHWALRQEPVTTGRVARASTEQTGGWPRGLTALALGAYIPKKGQNIYWKKTQLMIN